MPKLWSAGWDSKMPRADTSLMLRLLWTVRHRCFHSHGEAKVLGAGLCRAIADWGSGTLTISLWWCWLLEARAFPRWLRSIDLQCNWGSNAGNKLTCNRDGGGFGDWGAVTHDMTTKAASGTADNMGQPQSWELECGRTSNIFDLVIRSSCRVRGVAFGE